MNDPGTLILNDQVQIFPTILAASPGQATRTQASSATSRLTSFQGSHLSDTGKASHATAIP